MYKLLTNAHKWQNENKSEHQHFQKALTIITIKKNPLEQVRFSIEQY
jgi:hypothetical protein